jgi:hypothetical protein
MNAVLKFPAAETTDVSLAAKQYVGAGLILVAFDRGSKGPHHRGWNRLENCIRTIAQAAECKSNIGIAHAYSGTCCIDIDDMTLAAEWFGGVGIDLSDYWNAPDAVRMVSGMPNRGKIIYRTPAYAAALPTRMFKGDGVELRCATAGGLTVQDVLPPSTHPVTGKPYSWLGPGNWREIPMIPPDLLAFWQALAAPRDSASGQSARVRLGREDIETLLRCIKPESLAYGDWLHVGMGLNYETGGNAVGLELWDQWSAGDGKNPLYKGREELASKWAGFDPKHPNPRTIHTIEKLAGTTLEMASEYTHGDVIDFTTLARTPPKPRRWVRDDWIPRAKLTLVAGAGGVGKSQLKMQLQTCIANGLPWLGVPGIQGPTLGIYCEDDEDELRWRQAKIFEAHGLNPATCSAGINMQSRVGRENLLFAFDANRCLKPTKFHDELHAMLKVIRPVFLGLDNSAQMYNGSEIDRPMVTAFCNKLSGWALEFDMAVCLLAHPAKVEGSEFSGSTAWDAAVRARLYLQRNKDGSVTLKKVKANYSNLGEMDLEYRHGIFAPRTAADVSKVEASAEPVVLAALEHFTNVKQATSQKAKAQNNLIKLADRGGLLNGTSMEHGAAALAKLIASGVIVQNVTMPWRGEDRHHPIGLATAAAAARAAEVEAAKAAAKSVR